MSEVTDKFQPIVDRLMSGGLTSDAATQLGHELNQTITEVEGMVAPQSPPTPTIPQPDFDSDEPPFPPKPLPEESNVPEPRVLKPPTTSPDNE